MMTPPKATATLTKAIAAAKVVQLENCGHDLMGEQPDAVLDNLFGFVGR
jgi:pimeloyl-ACP methyl ester carboxylesterase